VDTSGRADTPPPVAADEARTAERLTGALRRAGGLALAAGVEVTGEVVGTLPGGLVDGGALVVAYEVDGTAHTTEVATGVERTELAVGDPVALRVDPDDPTRATPADLASRPAGVGLLLVLGMLGGPVLLVLGAGGVRRWLRLRRVLSAAPWRRCTATTATTGHRGLLRATVTLGDGRDPAPSVRGPLLLAPVPRTDLAPLRAARSQAVWVAGPVGRWVVVAPSGLPVLLAARVPRDADEADRWGRPPRARHR
jgi:hypothetical protein